jgi:hypothetical protein
VVGFQEAAEPLLAGTTMPATEDSTTNMRMEGAPAAEVRNKCVRQESRSTKIEVQEACKEMIMFRRDYSADRAWASSHF